MDTSRVDDAVAVDMKGAERQASVVDEDSIDAESAVSDVVENYESPSEEVMEDAPSVPEPVYPHMDIEDMLKVPSTILFPLELSRYLKDKLTAAAEDNWHLTKQAKCQESELSDLRKLRDISQDPATLMRKESPTVLSGKIIDLSKRNRDMTNQIDGLKAKVQQLLSENDSLKRKIAAAPPPSLAGSGGDAASVDGSVLGTSRTGLSDVSSLSQQLTKTTNKMMEFRNQNQILQIELRTALRALCQEVGEGTTVKTVLKEVAGPESTWLGRQQQILALNQKVSDLQLKLAQAQQNAAFSAEQDSTVAEEGDGDQEVQLFHVPSVGGDIGGGGDGLHRNSTGPLLFNASAKRQVSIIQHCEKRKHNQMDKLSQELQGVKSELKTTQLEAKGSKARAQFLESQVRSLRVDLDEAGMKVHSKQESLQQALEELREVRQELLAVREREKKHRESSSAEVQEASQALARERGVVARLQKLISEKQEHLQRLDSKVARLQDDMHLKSSASPNALELTEKIKSLENQLQLATQSIHSAEKERERLLTLISNSVGEAQQERQSHTEAERLLSRALAILGLTDSCINRCLDAGHVTSKVILEEVEEIRALVRELKAGTNYSLDFGDHFKTSPKQSQSSPHVSTYPSQPSSATKDLETGSRSKAKFLPVINSRQLNSRK